MQSEQRGRGGRDTNLTNFSRTTDEDGVAKPQPQRE